MESVPVSETVSTPQPELPHAGAFVPDEPLVVIEASKAWVALNLRDIWAYRELLYFLTWRDVKVRYKQTDSVLDVCLARRLSFEHCTCEVSMALRSESANGYSRRLSRFPLRTKVFLAGARHFNRFTFILLAYSAYTFRRMEKSFADIV
jgi:hypothetical protein